MDPLPAHLRVKARDLRSGYGLSLSELAQRLDISPSTARRWTLDIELTSEQLTRIRRRRTYAAQFASEANAAASRRRRAEWQKEGRIRARKKEWLHEAGCLLYWAEGTKDRNAVQLANSDVYLLRLFRRFLRECFGIESDELAFYLHIYTGNALTVRQIEEYWLRGLELARSCLRNHSIDQRPSADSGSKKNKLPYGVGTLRVLRSTWLAQHIYGAIQEYGEFEEPRWLG